MVLLDNADLKCYRAFIQYHECSRASCSESVYMPAQLYMNAKFLVFADTSCILLACETNIDLS